MKPSRRVRKVLISSLRALPLNCMLRIWSRPLPTFSPSAANCSHSESETNESRQSGQCFKARVSRDWGLIELRTCLDPRPPLPRTPDYQPRARAHACGQKLWGSCETPGPSRQLTIHLGTESRETVEDQSGDADKEEYDEKEEDVRLVKHLNELRGRTEDHGGELLGQACTQGSSSGYGN